MSKKSKSTRLSQKSTTTVKLNGITLTQQTLEETFEEIHIDINDQVSNLVRYIVNRAGSQSVFKQNEIKKNVLPKTGSRYQEIVEAAGNILKNVYGYNMIVSDQSTSSSKEYIITNSLPYIGDPTITDEDLPADAHKVLLLLILSHIFMSHAAVSEVSLCAFLKSLNIDIERKHEIFGNVKDYIYHNLKNKKYLKIETDHMSKKTLFYWGLRAEKEISKHEVLKFVCKMYNDRNPNSWTNHFKIAEEQNLENVNE